MSLPNSILAYADCESFFEAGLNDPASVRVRCASQEAATLLRMRMNMFRKLDRQRNMEAHPPGTFMHGRSEYDQFVLQIREIGGEFWLCLNRAEPEPDRVVSMAEDVQLAVEHRSTLRIEPPRPRLELKPAEPEILPPIRRRI